MIDILLIVIPVILLVFCTAYAVKRSEKTAVSNELKDRIIKISKRPRGIKDNNHQLSCMDELMEPVNDEEFTEDMVNLFTNSYKISYKR